MLKIEPPPVEVKPVEAFATQEAAHESGFKIAVDGEMAVLINGLSTERKRELGLRLKKLDELGIAIGDKDIHAGLASRKSWRRYFSDRKREARRSG